MKKRNANNITIGFSTTNQFISGLIRWATRSSCSHAYIAFYDQTLDMRMVLQSQPWGLEVRPWNRWITENILVAEYEPVSGKLDNSLKYIGGLLGTSFDYSSAFITGITVCKFIVDYREENDNILETHRQSAPKFERE